MGLFDKAKELAEEHPDQVNEGLEKAKDLIGEKTDGKYDDQIDQGVDKAREFLGTDE